MSWARLSRLQQLLTIGAAALPSITVQTPHRQRMEGGHCGGNGDLFPPPPPPCIPHGWSTNSSSWMHWPFILSLFDKSSLVDRRRQAVDCEFRRHVSRRGRPLTASGHALDHPQAASHQPRLPPLMHSCNLQQIIGACIMSRLTPRVTTGCRRRRESRPGTRSCRVSAAASELERPPTGQ